MTILKNFCIEPWSEECICPTLRCGGIDRQSQHCPEHGFSAALAPILKTHFHPVQGEGSMDLLSEAI